MSGGNLLSARGAREDQKRGEKTAKEKKKKKKRKKKTQDLRSTPANVPPTTRDSTAATASHKDNPASTDTVPTAAPRVRYSTAGLRASVKHAGDQALPTGVLTAFSFFAPAQGGVVAVCGQVVHI